MSARNAARISTGISGIDTILGGGLPKDRLYLVQGEPGSGKTTVALQYLLEGARNGEPTLYVTLSETKEELGEVARSHGWSLDALTLFELEAAGGNLEAEEQYTLFHPSEVELTEFTRKVLGVVDRVKPVRAVFDSLSELRLLAQDPLRYRRQVLVLKQFFIGRKCTVLLIDDGTDQGADLQLQSLAHGVIQLEQVQLDFGASRHRMRIMKMRGVKFLKGFHDFTIQTGGVEIYPRLVAADHRVEFTGETCSTGRSELDALLGGGIERGTSTLLMGPAGSGKSALASQIAVACARRGERVGLFSFEEGLAALLARAEGLGMTLEEHVKTGMVQARAVDPGELAPGQFIHVVTEGVERNEIRTIVIDSLNGYLNAMPNERALNVQLHELFAYLAQMGVVTILTMAQHGFVGEHIGTPLDISYLADNVILLRYFESAGQVRKAVSVVKKRRGGHERTIRELHLGSGGLRIGEPLAAFQGVLTGFPTYLGDVKELFQGDDKPTG